MMHATIIGASPSRTVWIAYAQDDASAMRDALAALWARSDRQPNASHDRAIAQAKRTLEAQGFKVG